MARRKRKTSTTPVTRNRQKGDSLKRLKKPPGIRVEDLKPWSIFKYIEGGVEEVHVAIPHKIGRIEKGQYVWGSFVPTIKLKGDDLEEGEMQADTLFCEMHAWDYKIELLDDSHAFKLQAFGNKAESKVFKPRAKSNDSQ